MREAAREGQSGGRPATSSGARRRPAAGEAREAAPVGADNVQLAARRARGRVSTEGRCRRRTTRRQGACRPATRRVRLRAPAPGPTAARWCRSRRRGRAWPPPAAGRARQARERDRAAVGRPVGREVDPSREERPDVDAPAVDGEEPGSRRRRRALDRVKAIRRPSGENEGITSNGPLGERRRAAPLGATDGSAASGRCPSTAGSARRRAAGRAGAHDGTRVAAEGLQRRRHGQTAEPGAVRPHGVQAREVGARAAAALEREGDAARCRRTGRAPPPTSTKEAATARSRNFSRPSLRAADSRGVCGWPAAAVGRSFCNARERALRLRLRRAVRRRARAARRQGHRARRDDRSSACPCPPASRSRPTPAAPTWRTAATLPGRARRRGRGAHRRARGAHRQALRRPARPAARLGPLGRGGLDARDDGHDPQPRPRTTTPSRGWPQRPATRASPTTRTAG